MRRAAKTPFGKTAARNHSGWQNPLAKLGSTSNCVLEPHTTLPVPKTPKNDASSGDAAKATAAAPAEDVKSTPAKKRAKSAKSPGAKTTAAAKKKSPASGGKKAAAKRPSAKSAKTENNAPVEPSDADIRLRAYFIAERRVQLALQGDPARDWIEARQQLLQEARETSS